MAPNPRVAKAFRAMKDLGILEEKTKPVLKKLLKLYEKKWELIEEENYRALADAIFDQEETQVEEKKNPPENNDVNTLEAEASEVDETERPLKRLRLKHQDNNGSVSINNPSPSTGVTPLKHKLPGEGSLPENQSPLTRNKTKALTIHEQSEASQKGASDISQQLVIRGTGSDPVSPTARYKDKGKAPLIAETVSGDTNSALQKSSQALCLKEPKPEPGTEPSKRKRLNTTRVLITPKDEPITDGMPEVVLPISVIHPDPSDNEVSLLEEHRVRDDDCPDENQEDGHTLLNKKGATEKAANIGDGPSSTDIQIAASPCGEESVDVTQAAGLLEHSDTVGGNKKAIDPIPLTNSADADLAEDHISLPSTDADLVEDHISLPSTDIDDGQQTDNITAENGSANEVNGSENASDLGVQRRDNRIQYDLDIANGHEKVVISLMNEVNDENPPSFRYIPHNVVFQNAYVNFSLARLGDDNSCAACSGNCLSSSLPCACARDTGGDYAYTIEGLVKEELLKECISMNRNPQKNCQYYCKECPLERLKSEEIIEPCKGHLVRKFIKECWWKCGCNRRCGNRVVQRGISINLQVFMTPGGKGWGLRTLQDLPKGAFVCEYVGEILTNAELFERVSARSDGEAHAYPVLLDADWGAEGVLKDEEALCLDATYYGNVARFINHRCFDSNMVEIPVEVETPDHHYYHLAFFTTRKVQAMEELTWDYGIDFDDHEHPVKAFKCHCGSKFCRNIKRNSRSKSRK
ncbi:probable inactive histone-lysine N-methyltransferase SUVR1 isoform X2 [Impatiens glandulifera]|uniref:probable inactive histone-lysine N-methyltransferase SUVR1 isoform X2 n=1 Tax=Impatiens glandulifera TaxID=253017 RepID=UPI001FB106A5|nr:probable inactive histone-lysine N-methyltransferase SUVR1 isoform X2 [Impatiens glandulifera]